MNSKEYPIRPWYKEPWPWVVIGILTATVLASAVTLYLAVSNPDPIVLKDDQYEQVKSQLRLYEHDSQGKENDVAGQPGGDDGEG